MSYKKILVDNPKCSRRFHITFDDSAEKLPKVELRCFHCDAIIFEAKDHPEAHLARDENLVTAPDPNSIIARTCHFKDKYGPGNAHKPS
jgi:hypothetical protein